MAVHNGEPYLCAAVESILTQTFQDLELIVVDDGSTDNSLRLLQDYATNDARLKVLKNESNIGLASSLNKGFSAARGTYVARMDSDDISLPHRLERQVSFMDSHPDISVCGTWANLFGHQNAAKKYPTEHDDIRASLLFYTPVFHPSVMFRKSDIAQLDHLYEDKRQRVEDLELWSRLTTRLKMANLPEYLLKYRVYNPSNVEKRKAVVAHGNAIRKTMLQTLVPDLNQKQFSLHMKIAWCHRNDSIEFMHEAADWLEHILNENKRNACFESNSLSRIVSERWWRVCKSSTELGPKSHRIYQSHPRLTNYNPGLLLRMSWFCKRLVSFRNANDSIHDDALTFVTELPENLAWD
jgi:glycosyltransferase involved in cell wall biosynthesis